MYKIDTKLAQIGNHSDDKTGTVNAPVYFSTAYRHPGLGQSTGFDYTRTGNPTRQVLEQTIAFFNLVTNGLFQKIYMEELIVY